MNLNDGGRPGTSYGPDSAGKMRDGASLTRAEPLLKGLPVPTYKLFGESDPWQSPDLVHCETIAERCSLHNWEIRPHRHDNLAHFIFFQRGHASITVETTRECVDTPCLVFIPPHLIHGFLVSDDITGFIVTMPHSLLNELVALAPGLQGQLNQFRLCQLDGGDGNLASVASIFQLFVQEYTGQEPGRVSMLMAHLTQIAVWLARLGKTAIEPKDGNDDRRRVDRFQDLINSHFADWKPLSFYADRLGISTRQLNVHCRRATGRSAQHLIHDRLLLEARRLLAYSDLSVTSISYTLGFSEPGYFSRFFARALKLTPSEFRQSVQANRDAPVTH